MNGTVYSPMTIADIVTFPVRKRAWAALLTPLGVALVLAAVGGFGTYIAMSLPLRIFHFAVCYILIGGLIVAVSTLLKRYVFAGPLPLWATIAVAAAMAPPGALIVRQLLSVWAPQALPHVSFGELTLQVLAINLVVSLIRWTVGRSVAPKDLGDVAPLADAKADAADDALREKLPFALRRATILALSSEDHYVRVHTDRGETLVLMNLSAAIAALGEEAGVRIHRSHWVARAIAERAEDFRKGVRIDDKTVLPVSRAGRKLLPQE